MKNYWKKNFKLGTYKKAQEKLNKEKLNVVWVRESEIEIIADYLRKRNSSIKFGICHGSRNGFEVQAFKKYLKIDVIGTDIAKTARNFPNMIQWDMHKVKDEWVNNVDFIYSNSIDHTYDIHLCIEKWLSCLNSKGILFLHFGYFWKKKNVSPGDCFLASEAEYKELINRYGRILDIIQTKVPNSRRGVKSEELRVVWAVGKKETQ